MAPGCQFPGSSPTPLSFSGPSGAPPPAAPSEALTCRPVMWDLQPLLWERGAGVRAVEVGGHGGGGLILQLCSLLAWCFSTALGESCVATLTSIHGYTRWVPLGPPGSRWVPLGPPGSCWPRGLGRAVGDAGLESARGPVSC